MQTQEETQFILSIAGMHRSGTSITASLLQSTGLDIGQRLMGGNENNLKGYFEDLDFVEFHEKVLYSQGISKEGWTLEKNVSVPAQYLEVAQSIIESKSSKKFVGWKDPRTTLFLNFWAEFIPQAKFLLVYRSPWEVIDSLYRRGDEIFSLNPNFALKVWVSYNQAMLDFYNRFPSRCILLSVDSIISDPTTLVKVIEEKFGVSLSPPADDIYDDSLLHKQISISHRPAIIEHYFPEAFKLYQALNDKAGAINEPNLSSGQLVDSQDYAVWAFQDWLDIRKIERESKFLLAQSQLQWQEAHARLQETQYELEQSQYQVRHTQNLLNQSEYRLQEAQYELERSQYQLQHTQNLLNQSEYQRQETQYELERSQYQLQETQNLLNQSEYQLQQSRYQQEQTQHHLQDMQEHLEQSQATIQAMESSKFWQVRTGWFKVKKLVGLAPIESLPPLQPSHTPEPVQTVLMEPTSSQLAQKSTEGLVSPESSQLAQKSTEGLVSSESSQLVGKSTQGLVSEARRSAVIARLEIAKFYETNFSKELWSLVQNQAYDACSSPCISVVVTLFNYSNYITECLDSVAKSVTCDLPGGFEVIVVDDGSTDGSIAVAQKYLQTSDIPICLVKKSLNTGLGDARNAGIKLARGSYIFILDADNWIYPNCLSTLYSEIQSGNYAAVYSLIKRFDSESGRELGLLSSSPWDVSNLVKQPYIDAMAMFSRDALIKAGGYSTELIYYGWFGWEDYDLWLKLAQLECECKLVPEVLCSYRVHSTSMINTTSYYTYSIAKYLSKKFSSLVEQYSNLETIFGFHREGLVGKNSN